MREIKTRVSTYNRKYDLIQVLKLLNRLRVENCDDYEDLPEETRAASQDLFDVLSEAIEKVKEEILNDREVAKSALGHLGYPSPGWGLKTSTRIAFYLQGNPQWESDE